MDAVYDCGDVNIYVYTLGRCNESLAMQTTQLTTFLVTVAGTDMGKRVDLMSGNTTNPDGLELGFIDEDDDMNDITSCIGIRVTINAHGYETFLKQGRVETTYSDGGKKLRILGLPFGRYNKN